MPLDLSTEPFAIGSEHEVWQLGDKVIKLTHPNFFGLRVIYRPDEDQKCSPCEYFERWVLHNEIFGDDVEILGVLRTLEGLRTVISQTSIEGVDASLDQIEEFFNENGWQKIKAFGETAWFEPALSVVVSDTHRGNLIRTEEGALVPIDFRIQAVSGAMLDSVRQLAAK